MQKTFHLMCDRLSTHYLNMASLLHDVGKLVNSARHVHYGMIIAEAILDGLKVSNKFKDDVLWIVQNHMKVKEPWFKMKRKKREALMQNPLFPSLIEFSRADDMLDRDTSSRIQEEYDNRIHKVPPPKLISGHDIIRMGVTEGKEIGVIIKMIKELQLEGTITTPEEAANFAMKEILLRTSEFSMSGELPAIVIEGTIKDIEQEPKLEEN